MDKKTYILTEEVKKLQIENKKVEESQEINDENNEYGDDKSNIEEGLMKESKMELKGKGKGKGKSIKTKQINLVNGNRWQLRYIQDTI